MLTATTTFPYTRRQVEDSQRIANGEPITSDYRIFCEFRGLSPLVGVFHPDAPRALPYEKAVRCAVCESVFEKEELDKRGDAWICTLRGFHTCPSGEDPGPDEFVQCCPHCGTREDSISLRRDLFVPVIHCHECDYYPCICENND